jgi:hypothetical protein
LVASTLPVRLLERVKLKIEAFPGPSKVKLTAEALVVRVEPGGFAVEWCEFAPPAIRALIRSARAQMLEQQTDGPSTAAVSHPA